MGIICVLKFLTMMMRSMAVIILKMASVVWGAITML